MLKTPVHLKIEQACHGDAARQGTVERGPCDPRRQERQREDFLNAARRSLFARSDGVDVDFTFDEFVDPDPAGRDAGEQGLSRVGVHPMVWIVRRRQDLALWLRGPGAQVHVEALDIKPIFAIMGEDDREAIGHA